MAVDHLLGRYVGIAVWTDSDALEASGREAPRLIADLAWRLHGKKPSVEVFDLVLAHLVKPVRVGYWGRFERLQVSAQDLTRAVRTYKETVLAMFDRYEGLASILLFADHASGVIGNMTWYDCLPVLRGSTTRVQEVRELLVADVPTVKYVESSELEVVIAETQDVF